MTIIGTLVLFSDRALTDMRIPKLEALSLRRGSHVNDKHKGYWTEATDLNTSEIYLPQRYKRMTLTTSGNEEKLRAHLSSLDSEWENARQLYKLGRMLDNLCDPMTAVVNNVSTTTTESGSFYLMTREEPLYVNLVFDIEEHSVRLVWSSFDLKSDMQERKQFRYIFYALPTLINRPLFIHSQRVCSSWWKFKRAFGESRHGLLRSCNALELFLYKDPDIPNL